ncbi:MAG: hypothetical protein WCE49_13665 [Terrimicrobiaceae bacterium]
MGAICEIAMIGSCVGERMMTPGLVPYAATKGAVKMFTQGLSREVGSRGAHAALMGGRQGEDGKALGKVVLHPEGEFGSGGSIGQNEVFEPCGSGGKIWAEEDGANVGGDFGAQIEARYISLGV